MATYQGTYTVETTSNVVRLRIPYITGYEHYRFFIRDESTGQTDGPYITNRSYGTWVIELSATASTYYTIHVFYSVSADTYESDPYDYWYDNTHITVTVLTEPEIVTYTCYVYRNYDGSAHSYTTIDITPGNSYAPGSHKPTAPSGYQYDHVEFSSDSIPAYIVTSNIRWPEEDCRLDYYYTEISTGKVFIWNGSAWKPATAYIYNSGWKPATPYIYNGGWK